MLRDCGPGELIITKWQLKKTDINDKVKKLDFTDKCKAIEAFELAILSLKFREDIALYAGDKQGYFNCLASCRYGQPAKRDRLSLI